MKYMEGDYFKAAQFPFSARKELKAKGYQGHKMKILCYEMKTIRINKGLTSTIFFQIAAVRSHRKPAKRRNKQLLAAGDRTWS